MTGEQELNEMQMDALKEVGNIGASHAANSLSEMTGKKVGIVVPELEVIPIEDFPNAIGGKEVIVIGVLTKILGDLHGLMLFTFPFESALVIADVLMGRHPGSSKDLKEMDMSAIREVGNILTSSFTSAMSDFLSLKIYPSPPSLAHDMAGSLVEFLMMESGIRCDEAIMFNTNLDLSDLKVEGNLFLSINSDSLDRVLKKIKEKMGKWRK